MIERDLLESRARSAQDAQAIVGWIEDAQALYLFSGSRLTWPLTVEQLESMLEIAGTAAFVVVTPAGELVAHFDLTVDGTVARVGRVIIAPELRGRGLATQVLAIAVAQSRRLGAIVVRLNVITTNEPAIRAYRRAGFTVVAADRARADVTAMQLC